MKNESKPIHELVKQGEHYELVSREVWNYLHSVYTGYPTITLVLSGEPEMENGVDFRRVNNLANVTIRTGEPEAEDDNVQSIQGTT